MQITPQEHDQYTLLGPIFSWLHKRSIKSATKILEDAVHNAYQEVDKLHRTSDTLAIVDNSKSISEKQFFDEEVKWISESCDNLADYYSTVNSPQLFFWGYDPKFMEREETLKAIMNTLYIRKNYCGCSEYDYLKEVPPVILFTSQADRDVELGSSIMKLLAEEEKKYVEIIRLPSKIEKGAIIIPPRDVVLWDSTRKSVHEPEIDRSIYRRSLTVENLGSLPLVCSLFSLYKAYETLSNKISRGTN